jgi:hypothetical protein
MGRSQNEHITRDVAQELCLRTGSKAFLLGSISNLGGQYVVGVDAINCSNGDTLAKQAEEAPSKQEVLKALGRAATDLRKTLGESLASVQKFEVPVEATTASLEALKAFGMGVMTTRTKGDTVPPPSRFISGPPNWTQISRRPAITGSIVWQPQPANVVAELKRPTLCHKGQRTGKISDSSMYYTSVTGELEGATQVYELWSRVIPVTPS